MGFDAAIQSYISSELQIPALKIAGRIAAGLEVGDQLASFCLLFIMAGYVAEKPRLVKTFAGALAALAAGGIAVQALKHLIGRARPAMGLGDMTFIGPHFSPSGFDSFPSGHTTAMFALLALFCRFYPGWTIPLYIAGLAVSILARVITGQHFLTDVIGGALLGSAVGLLVAAACFRHVVVSPPAAVSYSPAGAAEASSPPRRGFALFDLMVVALFSTVVLLIGSGLVFTSGVLGVLTSLAVYFLARQLTGRDTALYSALVLSSSFLFVHTARTLPADTAWLFFTTLAFTYYGYSVAQGRRSNLLLALAYLSIGLGLLAKGAAALFPVPIFCLYEYLEDKSSFRSFVRRTVVRHGVFLVVVLIAAAPWLGRGFFGSAQLTGDFFLDDVVAKTGLTRHAGRVIYYLPLLAAALFPWSFFAIAYFTTEARRWSREPRIDRGSLLLMLWATVVVGVFPFIAARSPHSLALALPPVSCLVGRFMRDELAATSAALRFALLATLITVAAVIAAAIVLYRLRPEYGSLKLAAPFAVLGFFVAVAWLLRHRRTLRGLFAPLCIGALAFYLTAIVIAITT